MQLSSRIAQYLEDQGHTDQKECGCGYCVAYQQIVADQGVGPWSVEQYRRFHEMALAIVEFVHTEGDGRRRSLDVWRPGLCKVDDFVNNIQRYTDYGWPTKALTDKTSFVAKRIDRRNKLKVHDA